LVRRGTTIEFMGGAERGFKESPVITQRRRDGKRKHAPVRGRTQVSIPWGLVISCVGVLDRIGIFCGVHFLAFGTEFIDITRLVTRRRCGASAVSRTPHFSLCLFLVSNHTFASVLLPWVRTERAILAKLNPLAAQFAEHAMGLYL